MAAGSGSPALPLPLVAGIEDTGIDNTTLLFNAAIYRACHEIALKLAKGSGKVDTRSLPGDFAFRCFLANCLYILEDAGLCEHTSGLWKIAPEFSLPPVGDILKELYSERSERAVEAVLINNAYAEALDRIDSLSGSDANEGDARPHAFISDATLDHQAVHSEATRRRIELVLSACLLYTSPSPRD